MKKELLIFGSNGALGKGVTETLIKKDYDKIYLFDFKFDDKEANGNIECRTVDDLSIEENVKKAFSGITPGKDKSFFLFSTIGGFAGGNKLWETPVEEWEKMFNMNLKTSFLIAKHFSNLVRESFSGSLCFTAAYTGIDAEVGKAAYGASKGGLIHLVDSLSLEGREINLSVNAIAPFIIDTPANRGWMKGQDFSKWIKPNEIGNLVNDIFKNYNFITGNIIKLTSRFDIFR
ncbi:MAG TPA: SDR family NAD(P)-dependent oxidoreductase [Ignavibacteriaceae bacterium]|nr:SDR family NAD(P)-dependent oxidoreductase [Ignavibacteriaceae bacterium]